jgi:hypothetical protein
MKVIFSRKGFDSSYGGYPSPILPDGRMVSLPIPLDDDIKYSDLMIGRSTYYDLMSVLKPKIKCKGKWLDLTEETRCHLDPDIHREAIEREPDWKSCFGQIDAAQSHLENQGVAADDLFLFFGWFRKTRYHSGRLEYDPAERDMHAIFGYFQIGEIKKVKLGFTVPNWMAYHPHATGSRLNKRNNTIYIARDRLSWDSSTPGSGRLMFHDDLVLTKKGLSRSKWSLPYFFEDSEISYHSKNSWKADYFQSAAIGQEFVIKENKTIEEWCKRLIGETQKDY